MSPGRKGETIRLFPMILKLLERATLINVQINELEDEALAKKDVHITEDTFNDLTAQFI
mgnify:CR=1 FL=1